MIFLFSKCLEPSKTSEIFKKTTYSSAKASSQQCGGQGDKENTKSDEKFPGHSKFSGMKSVPVVQSKAVWIIWNSLGIPAKLDNDSDEKGFEIQSETKMYTHCAI
ncbi:hypothetical protein CDAR_492571 [Caerostris darwini]|uniref:Uncharacterized protein n=1 Tax=Caerostris darwini TaxID=1538125 RepID=A0AAV4V0D7_9ARAC|nr:hypothetical protein CDAR_492571 [Caerostris darwini]